MRYKLNLGLENKFYIIFLSAISILLVVFFTSKLWLYDDEPIMQTPFNTEITGLNQTHLKLKSWEYNPENELMEVVIETLHKGSDVIKPSFSFKAKERNVQGQYPVKVVYDDDANIVVQIKNVPPKFRVVGLYVIETRDEEMLLSENKEQLIERSEGLNEEDELTFQPPKPTQKIIIGDYRKIKVNKRLETKDAIEYQKNNIELEMKQLIKKINYILKEQIPLQDRLVKSLEKEIISLESEIKYQTSDEQTDTKQLIVRKKESIKKAKDEKESLINLIGKYEEKYEKLEQKLQSINNNKEEKQTEKEERKNK